MKSKIYKGNWNLDYVEKNSDKLFVFGDNQMKIGKKGQAIIRDAKNSIGITTKKSPSRRNNAYFNDIEFEKNKDNIIQDILNIKYKALSENKIIIFSSNGYGNGLAEMNTRAPKTYDFINNSLKQNFNFDNLSGKITTIIPGYDEIKSAFYINLTKDNNDIIMPSNNSLFRKEYLHNSILTIYDLILYHKKISFTHKKSLEFKPDDIIIFKFDNIKNYILCRVSQTFDMKYINKDKWEMFEGFGYHKEISNEYVQTHFKYISILDSNNNMILPGDLFSNIKDDSILESEKDKEILFENTINPKESTDELKDAYEEHLEVEGSESEKIEKENKDLENKIEIEKIFNILNELKEDFVSKKELVNYSDSLVNEIKSLIEEGRPKSFWERIFGK
jgi:hypothetical protein